MERNSVSPLTIPVAGGDLLFTADPENVVINLPPSTDGEGIKLTNEQADEIMDWLNSRVPSSSEQTTKSLQDAGFQTGEEIKGDAEAAEPSDDN